MVFVEFKAQGLELNEGILSLEPDTRNRRVVQGLAEEENPKPETLNQGSGVPEPLRRPQKILQAVRLANRY